MDNRQTQSLPLILIHIDQSEVMKGELPINSAARNSLWVYPVARPPRFAGAPAVIETTRSYELPDVPALPGGADVRVEFYGGAYSFWLDGERCCVYVGRFDYVSFTSEEEARHALLTLWREVERLESPAEVERAAARWLERRRGERTVV
jgi:hypothetical protein